MLRAARDTTVARQSKLRELAARHADALADLRNASTLTEALGVEGHAARDYFQGLDILAPGAAVGRTRRPPLDPVNCLLSFGYGMLRVAVHGGLDPYVGYLHGVRPGSPRWLSTSWRSCVPCWWTAWCSP
jgi:CRISPR-associated protein Cas1